MTTLKSHLYTGPADLQAMISLTQTRRAAGQRVYPIAADLYEELSDQEVQSTARIWHTNDTLVGFAYVNQYQNLVDVFDERVFTPAIEAEMMDWAVVAARQRNKARCEALTLDASANDCDQPRLALLARHEFERTAEDSLLFARPLEGDLHEPRLPNGFSIRPMAGEAEVDAYVALHRAAFGTENMTVDYRRTIMSVPSYLPELDLVAVAPTGELAAFCVCQIFPDNAPRAGGQHEGWTDPVGTQPRYQRLGLAKALIVAGMHRLKARGIDTALLGTSNKNLAMRHVAEALGFRLASRTLFFAKKVS
jgi:ribosomal protein S18 acetylase RimI-like enzyme